MRLGVGTVLARFINTYGCCVVTLSFHQDTKHQCGSYHTQTDDRVPSCESW